MEAQEELVSFLPTFRFRKNVQIPHSKAWCWHLRKEYLPKEQSKASKGLQFMPVLINPKQRASLSILGTQGLCGIFEPDSVVQSLRKPLW